MKNFTSKFHVSASLSCEVTQIIMDFQLEGHSVVKYMRNFHYYFLQCNFLLYSYKIKATWYWKEKENYFF
jgi:hypothetical protein